MNLLLDAHLPISIAGFFKECIAIHTSQLEMKNQTSDKVINDLSMAEKWVVITKDSDFYYSYIREKIPYKLILVKLGNMRLKELHEYFRKNSGTIITLMQTHSFLILEPEKIRILD